MRHMRNLYTYLVAVMETICDNDTFNGELDWDNKIIAAASGLWPISVNYQCVS